MNASINRRGFLKNVAAAASASVMARATAQGTAANARVKAGVIGLGSRGSMIAGMVRGHDGYEVVAVADYFQEVADRAGEKLGVPNARRFSGLEGYRRLLDTDVEAVFLETPPYCFPEHVEAAVDAGRHVYMAKPIACDVPGALRVDAAAKKAKAGNKVFLVDFQMRTEPLVIEGIERIHGGEVGPIGLLSSIYTDEGFSDPPQTDTIESRLQHLVWVNDTALGGGFLVNAGIHAVDVGLWLAGANPVAAMGSSRLIRGDPHGDTHDVYSLTYEFADGLALNHQGEHVKNRFGFCCECSAYCRDGYLDTAYVGQVRILGNSAGWRGGEVEALYTEGAKRNIAAFHQCVVNGNCTNGTVDPSINATLATILGREACERKTRVTWEQMLGENRRLEPNLAGLKA
ncbi:MAG TPA: Gfo/Idh/MocA family oxidoreductase [Candidatus Hydrogenedentes bacterium]|nr:Gfo/Idh/MocA family oxidoreductase [Candidatus Hydrogenedentota bacterium]HPG68758.1 Gfo/Idh/MocA family oxidoreductase [Candidatus Hydrogenedentota bacterium]